MYQLKGFMSMPSLIDNTPNAIARFGELSSYSKTFAKDIKEWSKPTTAPNAILNTTLIIDSLNQTTTPNLNFTNSLVELGQFIYNSYIGGSIPTNTNRNAFINSIRQVFPQFTNISIGELMAGTQPSRNMPDYLKFNCSDGNNDYIVKIWFSDARFRTQYEDKEIIVIPPLADLDDLNTGIATLGNLLALQTPGDMVNRIQQAIGQNPQSYLLTRSLTWHDPSDTNSTRKTDWCLIVYGQAGADADAIKNAIRDYISSHTVNNNWALIYPELYSDNEFVVIPFWNTLAIPNNALDSGVYSPMESYGSLLPTVLDRIPTGYKTVTNMTAFMNNNLYFTSTVYRTLLFGVVGNPNNNAGITHIKKKYPDYISVPTTSPDFARMSTTTQQFVLNLNRAFEIARSVTPTDPLPTGYTLSIRNSRYYVTFQDDAHTFMVLTNFSFLVE